MEEVMNNTEKRVLKVVEKVLGELPSLDSNFQEDLGADSLDRVEICMELEREFNISIPDEDIWNQEWNTIGEIVLNLEKYFNETPIKNN